MYDHVHRVLGHPGEEGMQWHTIGANYTKLDASKPRPLCLVCVEGTMRQTSTDHRREHRISSGVVSSQLTLDAYLQGSSFYRGYRHGDLFTDINTGEVFPIMTKDRGAEELCLRASILFNSHPEWRSTGSDIDRFIRVDPENSYRSTFFMQCASKYDYRIEPTPARDKHANGIAERTVGTISAKTNLHMLAPTPRVPNKYWCLCMEYACKTASFNYHRKLGTSTYFYAYGQHVNIKHLHPFWSVCWVFISLEDRKGKIDFPCAYKAYFVGYESTRTLEPTYKVILVPKSYIWCEVRISKDIIFDDTIDFHIETETPTDSEFNRGIDEQGQRLDAHAPSLVRAPTVPIIPVPMPVLAPSPIIPTNPPGSSSTTRCSPRQSTGRPPCQSST